MKIRGGSGTSAGVRGIVIGLGLALGLTTTGAAQERPGGGMGDGIKVHGHWTIVVKNEDGTLASRNEFENHLLDPAAMALLLGRKRSVGQWHIELFSPLTTPPTGICAVGTQPTPSCQMLEGPLPHPAPTVGNASYLNLDVDVPATGPSASKLVLAGSLKATYAGKIAFVHTGFWTCPPDVLPAPNACTGGEPRDFTTCAAGVDCVGIAAPIDIKAKQTVEVTVEISFS